MHIVTRAWGRRSAAVPALIARSAPEQPIGWPSAVTPPFGFTFRGSVGASGHRDSLRREGFLTCNRVDLVQRQAAFLQSQLDRENRPPPMISFCTPATAYDTNRANGLWPAAAATEASANTQKAAPSSLMPDAFPAVTELCVGQSFANVSHLLMSRLSLTSAMLQSSPTACVSCRDARSDRMPQLLTVAGRSCGSAWSFAPRSPLPTEAV